MLTTLVTAALLSAPGDPVAQQPNPLAAEMLAALRDAKRLDPAIANRTVYLTHYNTPEVKRPAAVTVVGGWANSLSSEAEIVKPRRVTDTLYALNIDDYGWDKSTWDKLADEDPYFHVQILVQDGQKAKKYFPHGNEYGLACGWHEVPFKGTKTASALAPWLPAAEAAELVTLTQTAAPIVRADWWFSRTAIQAGRKGTGYYDWFTFTDKGKRVVGIKDRDAFQRLVALDVKESQRVRKEVAGIVARSGVANFPRQILRFQAVTGGYWETRDALDDNAGARNALRNLDADFKHQAEEQYAVLPNGLFVFFLSDANGVRQDSAPDKIGSDKTAPGNDGRIHVGVSCVRCHVEGLRPINDWARRVYQGPLKLASPEPDRLRRLRQLYLGELTEKVADDVALYSRALKRATGQKPDEWAKAVGTYWASYVERDLLPGDVAADLGIDEKAYLEKLRAAFKGNPLSDPVLASHLADPPIPIRADDVEQLAPVIYATILGAGAKREGP